MNRTVRASDPGSWELTRLSRRPIWGSDRPPTDRDSLAFAAMGRSAALICDAAARKQRWTESGADGYTRAVIRSGRIRTLVRGDKASHKAKAEVDESVSDRQLTLGVLHTIVALLSGHVAERHEAEQREPLALLELRRDGLLAELRGVAARRRSQRCTTKCQESDVLHVLRHEPNRTRLRARFSGVHATLTSTHEVCVRSKTVDAVPARGLRPRDLPVMRVPGAFAA